MDKPFFKDYVENRYRGQLNYFRKAAALNQKRYKGIQWVLIILSAATPVMAAFINEDARLQVIVVVVSGIVAILTTVLKTFQYQEQWINYRNTAEVLKPEYYYYSFGIGPYADNGVDKEALFVTRVEAVLDKEHSGWLEAKKRLEATSHEKDESQNIE